jgi:transcriptional regulator with XRE-family HTH domain
VFTSTLDPHGSSSIKGDSTSVAPDSINKLIGERMHLRRTSLGVSRQELSKFLRIDPSELDACETGAKRINAKLLLQTAKILDVGVDYFFRSDAGESKQAQVDGEHRRSEAA